jgi:hypothetical protein
MSHTRVPQIDYSVRPAVVTDVRLADTHSEERPAKRYRLVTITEASVEHGNIGSRVHCTAWTDREPTPTDIKQAYDKAQGAAMALAETWNPKTVGIHTKVTVERIDPVIEDDSVHEFDRVEWNRTDWLGSGYQGPKA